MTNTIGRNIRTTRERLGMEQQELLPKLRFKARINCVDFDEKDISKMTKAELKAQINEIWRKI